MFRFSSIRRMLIVQAALALLAPLFLVGPASVLAGSGPQVFLPIVQKSPGADLNLLQAPPAEVSGVVYTQSNAPAGNEVLLFERSADGSLSPAGAYATGGLGSGANLGSQGSVILSDNQRLLLVANSGSSDISMFLVKPDGLELLDVVSSQGEMPISLTNHGRFVYVLNAGGAGNIAGFQITAPGKLTFIEGSIRGLSNAGSEPGVGPAQVEFSPDGSHLVVTEKATNMIDVYQVGPGGRVVGLQVFPSSGVTPFGFAISKANVLVVSEAFMGAPGASAVSSYQVAGGALQLISPSVANGQGAACWVMLSADQKYAFITNTGSNSISSYALSKDGALTLLKAAAGETGGGPTDMALAAGGRYLYSLDAAADTISAFRVLADGGLEQVDFEMDLPGGAFGLAAR